MKFITSLLMIVAVCLVTAQNPETNSGNWVVTKLANTDQLVSFPNEITYGPDGWLWITERATNTNDDSVTGERVVRVHPDTGVKTEMLDLHNEVYSAAGQDGLMGMAIHPDLYTNINTTTNNYVYLALTYFDNTSAFGKDRKLRLVRFDYVSGTNSLNPSTRFVLIEGLDASNDHNSGRLKIGPDLKLYYTVGDLGANQFSNKCERIQAQALPTQSMVNNSDWSTYKGKLLRLNLDGTVPSDNPVFFPFTPTDANPIPDNADTNRPDSQKVRSHIFTYGHRNAQGIIFDSAGNLYQSEHGDRVDDEVNIIQAGKNYGWPLIVGEQDNAGYQYCIKASDPNGCTTGNNSCPAGATVHAENAFTLPVDFEGPIATYNSTVSSVPQGGFLTWPTVAPSSIDVYEPQATTGSIPWNKSILIPTLKKGTIYRYEIDNATNGVQGNLIEFHSSIDRYRDITISPDGTTIYAVTDSSGSTSGPTGSSSLSLQNPGAIIKIEYVPTPEPSNQPTAFTATAQSGDINLSWTDATGSNVPSGYLITASTIPGNLTIPVDGTDSADDTDLSDGDAIVKVDAGIEGYTFAGLTQGETYYFQIHSYSNFGNNIDYLTSPTGPTANDDIPFFPTLYISEITNTLGIDDSNFVEIYNYGQNPIDLTASGVYLGRQAAGNPPTNRDELLSGIIQPGDYYIVGRSGFSTQYGFNPDLVVTDDNLLGGTGDDPYILVHNGSFLSGTYDVLDIFGELGVDGDNEPWNYVDSRVVRKESTTVGSSVWIENEWEISSSTAISGNSPGESEIFIYIYNNGWTPADPANLSDENDEIEINGGNPVATGDITAKRLTVSPNRVFDLNGFDLNLAERLIVRGTLVSENSDFKVLAGEDFAFGTISTTLSFHDIDVSEATSTPNLSTNFVPLNVYGILKVGVNGLTVNDIIFKSTATQTAMLDVIPVGAVITTGDVTTERFIPARRAFRFISTSVNTTSSIYNNWQEAGSTAAGLGTHITGSNSGSNGFDINTSGNASMFGFDNVTQSWTAMPNTDNTNLTAGTPYRLFVRGDRTIDLSNNNATPSNTTLRSTGILKIGNETVTNLSSVAGEFNFVGNPYQAPVDLTQVMAASTNVNPNFVYFWDPTINTRGAYVTVDVPANSTNVTSNFNKFAQPHSSFFVTTLANGSTSMNFTESQKQVNEESLNIFAAPITDAYVKIQLFETSEFTQGLRERDAALLRINTNFNNSVNDQDALKFSNLDENIAIANGSDLLSIERRQYLQDGDEVLLNTTNYRSNQYELVVNLNGIITPAYIYDSYTNTYTALAANSVTAYSFTVDVNVAASIDSNRLKIVFSNTTLSNEDAVLETNVSVYPNPTIDGIINISGINSIAQLSLFNMLGQQIEMPASSISMNGNSIRVELPQTIVNGTYLLNVKTDNSNSTHKIVVE